MSDIEFRRPRPRSQPEDAHPYAGLWWRIALGVFVGALAHSVVVGIYVQWELQQLVKSWEAEAGTAQRELENALRQFAPIGDRSSTARSTIPRGRAAPLRPLASGERCVGGKRFRAVPNGWVQVNEPCG
ncbi:hypothetical protein [Luteimonas sp. MC1825]|uniref:hypothetical protein n=1 Tax=Luteimonas sp. MC1825 TaxID=2761107 RepID=UPI001607C572|nr:hypothetical protein [Luteimonas sp. MC1825]MBB6599595.1 hypothetical protein [Luteimonas sp. MC1825]QOC87288.1 hypothetical protein IDM46_08330 [Luteimonas sp. MC1825]